MKVSLFRKSWLCCLLIAFAATQAVAAAANSKTPAALVDGFVELALKNGYSTRRNPVRKWMGPVRYFIVHRVGDADLHRGLVDAHFLHLARITGLSIQPVDTRAAANFLVMLTSEGREKTELPAYFGAGPVLQREVLVHRDQCIVSFATERRGSIVRAVAMIPVDAARARADLAACVVEELTHAMGLGNDTMRPLPSIFSRAANLSFLSGFDYLVLKMLYDPRIKPGMKEKDALPVLHRIAVEYERSGLLATADREAAENGLASVMP